MDPSRRDLLTGAAALAAYGQLQRAEAMIPQRRALLGGVRPPWVQPGAIIDEDFFNQRAWPRPFATEMVDARASVQYVPNADGSLLLVSSGALPISNAYMEVEPTATNIARYSADFTQSQGGLAWGSTNATVTTSAVLGPDGLAANQWSFSSAGAGNSRVVNFCGNITQYLAQTWTGSVYLKADSSTAAQLRLSSNGVRYVGTQGIIITTAWKMFALTATGLGSDTGGVNFDIASNGASGVTIYGADAQVANASAASSFIPTTTASGVRAANAITIQRTGIGRIVFTFDDNSQQTVSGINTGTQYLIPTTLNRPLIKRMTGYAS